MPLPFNVENNREPNLGTAIYHRNVLNKEEKGDKREGYVTNGPQRNVTKDVFPNLSSKMRGPRL